MYRVLFSAVGNGKLEDVKEARDVLRTYLREMEREEPTIVLEEYESLCEAGMRALEFVEPKFKQEDGASSGSQEWKEWYERCVCGIDQAHGGSIA